jgi:predicted metallopeptidase
MQGLTIHDIKIMVVTIVLGYIEFVYIDFVYKHGSKTNLMDLIACQLVTVLCSSVT